MSIINKRFIHQEDITVLNLYLSNNIYSAYKEQNVAELQKEEVNFHKLGELIGEYSIVIEYKVNIKQLYFYIL